MKKLNFNKQSGDLLTATEVNQIGSSIDELIDHTREYNISKLYPTGGDGGTDKYTFENAINKIPLSERRIGVKCLFQAKTPKNQNIPFETYEYIGPTYSDLNSWELVGASSTNKTNKAVADIQNTLKQWAFQFPMCGFARVNGDVDPSVDTLFENSQISELGKHLRLMVVKNGVVQKIAARGRLTLSTSGESIAIDGTEGDVMLGFDIPVHYIADTKVIDGVETNCAGVGIGPCSWHGTMSQEQPVFAITPWETVNAKLDGENVVQSHCIYNKNVNGTYSQATDFFLEKIKTSGGGYPSLGVSETNNLRYAQSKNENPDKVFPYLGSFYKFEEIIRTMMYSECKTLNTSDLKVFGCGCTSQNTVNAITFYDECISGNSGIKIIKTDGNESYARLFDNFKPVSTGNGVFIIGGVCGSSWYTFVECGESVRVLDSIMSANLQNKIGVHTNVFTYESSGNIKCISDNSVNISTGDGMVPGQKYYVVRNVPNCEGLNDNVMTAVVNCYVKLTAKDGVTGNDGKTSYGGASFIFKFSHAIYRGWTLPLYCFRHVSYAYHTYFNENGNKHFQFNAAESVHVICPMIDKKSSGKIGDNFDALKGLNKKSDKLSPGNGYCKKGDYGLSLFYVKELGGNINSYECAYTWRDASWGNGGGHPEPGQMFVNASAAGCRAGVAFASARNLYADNSLGYGNVDFAGAFAVLPSFNR